MACGLPVVCCNNGGIGETVINSSGGIVADTDIEYQYDIIDYYNPPKPDYNKLIEVIDKIYINYQKYKNNINYNYLSLIMLL